MLADDVLGRDREFVADPLPDAYGEAFEAIDSDPNQELIVAESRGEIIGTLQLTFLSYLTHGGSRRAQIEAVRIRSSDRGSGTGARMIEWAIERARQRRCHIIQLMTDKRRPEALRFYRRLGFEPTHEGLKMFVQLEDERGPG